jgi:4-hydroxy-3-polyprenylbenzoate decarboxylase
MATTLKHLRSLRDYIDELATLGDVQPIDVEVDWKYEIGAVIRRSYDLRAYRDR